MFPEYRPGRKVENADSLVRPWPDSVVKEFHLEDDGSDEDDEQPIDAQEIYDLIAPIQDPEHPLTLGSLAVVKLPDITLAPLTPDSALTVLTVLLTPTITHCSLATVIGLGVRVRLEQALPPRFRVDVQIKPGTHSTAEQVNRQLADKERVAAAMENDTLMGVIQKMLAGCMGKGLEPELDE